MCQPSNGGFSARYLLLCFWLLCASAVTLKAGELNAPPIRPNLKLPDSSTSPSDSSLSKLWAMLKMELAESQQDSQALLTSLQQLQTEASALHTSLTALTEHYANLDSLLASEIAARKEAENSMQSWRAAALICGSVTVGGVLVIVIQALLP